MHKFKELKVWQKSVDLATNTYKVTAQFPANEKFGLISQINRSVVSVASNIAEGAGRKSSKEFYNFLSMANGSSYELETQLIISKNLNYLSENEFNRLSDKIDEIQKMIYALQKNIKTRSQEQLLKLNEDL
jgi:four helix bundle protein